MIPPIEVRRAREVRRALNALAAQDPTPWAQGLSAPMARRCLDLALAPLTIDALCEAAVHARRHRLPDGVGIVVAQGVFTSPIEWAALYATAGLRVHLKAPVAEPALCQALAAALAAQGLPVSASTDRELSGLETIVVFGDDATGAAVAAAWPQARVVAFGHRVSAVAVDVPPEPAARAALAAELALDLALYDSRGCMAPVAVLALGDADALALDLDLALGNLEATLPRGAVDPSLGPEWRRRLALARALGRAWSGPAHAVLRLPPDQVQPAALPRMAIVHAAPDLSPLDGLPLSSLAVAGAPSLQAQALDRAPRVVAPGMLQRPAFPRRHDGVDMLGCILG